MTNNEPIRIAFTFYRDNWRSKIDMYSHINVSETIRREVEAAAADRGWDREPDLLEQIAEEVEA